MSFEQVAIIESAELGPEHYAQFGFSINFNYGGSGQGLGWYELNGGGEWSIQMLRRTMLACGVDRWDRLVGRRVIVLREDDSWGAKIIGVKPLPFDPGEEFLFASIDDLAEQARMMRGVKR